MVAVGFGALGIVVVLLVAVNYQMMRQVLNDAKEAREQIVKATNDTAVTLGEAVSRVMAQALGTNAGTTITEQPAELDFVDQTAREEQFVPDIERDLSFNGPLDRAEGFISKPPAE